MNWRELWSIVTGLEPPVQYFPAVVSSIALFMIIFLICFILHRLSEIFLPESIRIYALDFFKTLAFCAYPFGIIILRKHHGNLGYALCAVPLNTATSLILESGEGSPVGNWLSLVKGRQSISKCVLRIAVQMAAGSAGFRLGKLLMNVDFHPDFEDNLKQIDCISALHVSVVLGIIIELLGTAWDTWFHSQIISKNIIVDKFLKFCNTSLTFCLGVRYTGMFMHPAKAFGLTFGCKGITPFQHILVYCIGPMTGSFIAFKIFSRKSSYNIADSKPLEKLEITTRVSSENAVSAIRKRKQTRMDK